MNQKLLFALKSIPHNKLRSDIINPKLCEDVLRRLAPSLAPYRGCTIIDINPGAGVFSQKLHEHLTPRSHILLEPKLSQYKQFLEPLLEASDSRYHLRDWPDEHRWDTTRFIHEGLMPGPNGSGGPAPTTDIPNKSALIVGNLVNWNLIVQGRTKGLNYTSMKALDFARSARQFARSGSDVPPRMLIWTTDSEKHSIIPRTIDGRGKTSALLEAYCHVEEIVGSTRPRKIRRENALDVRSVQRVAERVQDSGATKRSRDRVYGMNENKGLSSTYRDWHQELYELEKEFRAEKIPQFIGMPPGPLQQTPRYGSGLPKHTPEYKRMAALRRILKGQNAEIKKVGDLLQSQAEIDQLDAETMDSESMDEDEQRSKYEALDARIAELKEALSKLTKKELYRFMFLDDDRRAFEMEPPLLMWDRRTAEPLIAQEADFYHPRELTLLDFQAKSVPDVRATTPSQDMYYDMLVTALIAHKSPVTAKFLNSVGPGAYHALIKHVPSLRNPLKGGRRDIESVRARTMTPEMLRELAIAWDKWPFKPTLADTIIQAEPAMGELLREGGPASRQK